MNDPDTRQTVESVHESVWAIDATANTTYVIRRIAQIPGYTVTEMLGRPVFSYTDARGVEQVRGYGEKCQPGVAEPHAFGFIRNDGECLCALLATTKPGVAYSLGKRR
jgi:PAS domain S-box-containing protein